MPFAHSTQIDALFQALERYLKNVQHAAITLAALVIAADDAACHDAPIEPGGERASNHLRALTRLARDKSEELTQAISEAIRVIRDRSAYFEHSAAEGDQGDPSAAIKEVLDEALFVLESGGVQPIVLVFDTDERERLGEGPLARLVELLRRALEVLALQTGKMGEGARAANQVLAEALELAELLAEGAESRTWTDDQAVEEGERSEDPPA